MKRLNYSSEIMEKFAIRVLSKSFDQIYENYIWHNKDNDFDFTSQDDTIALEVATILPQNIINVIQYEKTLDNGKIPDIYKVISAHVDSDGELLSYYGGSMYEIRKAIVNMIDKKESKRINRTKKYVRYELCLCIDEGALFNTVRDFEFIINSNILNRTGFSRLFLITSSNFYVIENNIIQEYKRIID